MALQQRPIIGPVDEADSEVGVVLGSQCGDNVVKPGTGVQSRHHDTHCRGRGRIRRRGVGGR